MKLVQHDAYVHVSAIDQLPAAFRAPARRAVAACESWAPDVLQVMLKAEDPAETLIVKLACCDDFDGNPEPAILIHLKVRVSKGMPV